MQQDEQHFKKTPHSTSSFFTEIFGRIWALWGLMSFAGTFLIIFIPSMLSYLFPEKRGQDYFITVSRWWMQVWLWLVGCPVKVYGRDNFKPGQNYVVVFNHNALLDVPLSAPFIPGGNKTIAKASFAKVPVFGLFYKRGAVLVNRDNDKSRQQSFFDMKAVLQKGMHMCLYPEGTRNRTAQPLKPFYDGAFKLAVESGKDIIPCIITGTNRAMPIHKTFYLFPTRLKMFFLPAVPVAGSDAKQLKEKVFLIMKETFIAESR